MISHNVSLTWSYSFSFNLWLDKFTLASALSLIRPTLDWEITVYLGNLDKFFKVHYNLTTLRGKIYLYFMIYVYIYVYD